MLIKTLIWIAFLGILYCLGSGAFYLTRRGGGTPLASALMWRIILSLLLFGFLFLAYHLGWIAPHGVVQGS